MRKIMILLLSILMLLSGCGGSPDNTEKEITDLIGSIEPKRIGIYVLDENVSTDALKDYTLICQTEFTKGQDAAIQYLSDVNRWGTLAKEEKSTVYQAVKEFVENHERRALVMDAAYVDALKNNEKAKEFVKDLKLVWEYDDINAYDFSLVNNPFQIYVIGSDDRAYELNDYSHYDVDMIITANPKTKQVLVLSIPRDAYVKNYAYGENRDKLDYTGNSGLENAKAAINEMFNQNINLYILTNFYEFMKMIDCLGGIDIYNPYTFKLDNARGEAFNVGRLHVTAFPEGDYHLDGLEALAYARERFTLYDWAGSSVGKYNGDMARNVHHLIIMKGIINKLVSLETLANYEKLMDQIKNCFHTNISFSQMHALAIMQFIEHPDWNVVYQHMYAEYVSDICASEPDLGPLTVGLLDENDLNYVIDLMNKVMAGETITQEPIPSESY